MEAVLTSDISYHIDGLYHFPLSFIVSFSEIVMPNYQITITSSTNFQNANQDNANMRIICSMANQNTNVDYVSYSQSMQLQSDWTTKTVNYYTSSYANGSSTDNSNASSNDSSSTDSSSTDSSSTTDTSSTTDKGDVSKISLFFRTLYNSV